MYLSHFSNAYNGFPDGNNNDRNFMLDVQYAGKANKTLG